MSDLRKSINDVLDSYAAINATETSEDYSFALCSHEQSIEALRAALAETGEPVTRIQELERLVKAQQKAFDIESNRVTFANHKSLHKMLIRDAIKKMNDCKGRPYSAWDTWLIDATCMLERVLREWPAPQEVTLTAPPSIDALIKSIRSLPTDTVTIKEYDGFERLATVIRLEDINPVLDKYRSAK